ncbi:hypothetical protein Poli38472_011246 [Pythium oligandrum]|uniref:EF-hand domain-containing protein n=1 Tax=Pythium oligandrum TaxID=41045 RepID=A0A8K1CPW1_PYTOL|nr:hypothetical protein Poli38472_011246 [Pythium oligandrum]|eukprot:TMW67626.1 hypothetical protein Poli38472_011246 [Pythium oligandrum]
MEDSERLLHGQTEGEDVSTLPSSPTSESVDVTIELPFVTPSRALAIQAKRALLMKNALVATKLSTCPASALVEAVQERRADENVNVEYDEWVDLVRVLPGVHAGGVFQPVEVILERIHRSFNATNRHKMIELGIATLVLLQGSVSEKFRLAIKLASTGEEDSDDSECTKEAMRTALSCLLLSISALFDDETASVEEIEATAKILESSVHEAVNRMWSTRELSSGNGIYVKSAIPWADERPLKALPWLKLVDHAKWPVIKRLTSARSSSRAESPRSRGSALSSDYSEGPLTNESGDSTSALTFQFSSVDGGQMTIGTHEAEFLFDFLVQSAFTKVHAQAMYDTFVQHTGDGLLEEETFLEAIEELLAMTNQPQLMEDHAFLDQMLDIFRCFLPENCRRVDAFEIAAGFSLFSWGSKSDKLGSSFHYFDAESKGFLNRQQLWRFLRSVLLTLLYLSPPAENVVARYGSLAALVDTGEQEIMESVMGGINSDDDESSDEESDGRDQANSELRKGVYTFENFGLWYNSGGFKAMSWLELLDLRKWIFVSPHFQLDQLDVEPVDPVVASANYYTAQNFSVNMDADSGEQKFGFADVIAEEDDEDDDGTGARNHMLPPSNPSSYSSATTNHSNLTSVASGLPAIYLKNEIVLEFDLAFDMEDDSTVEVPLRTLCFDNGDLIHFFELQRVMRLNEVELYRLYDVFEPYMEDIASAWMEKSAFDECMNDLLPSEVADGVASAFRIHPHSRVPPPSIGRAKDCKMVADSLSRLFFAFNRGGTGKIDLIEFVSAFTLFCAGSKSEKLAFAYRLFDTDRDGALSRREMWKYLRSFLTMLLALGNGSELSAEAIASIADATAIAIADAIFKDMDKTRSVQRFQSVPRESHRFSLDTPESADTVIATRNARRGQYYHRGSLPNVNALSVSGSGVNSAGPGAGSAFIRGGVVTFEEFARWYSTNGYNIIAWIELLDAKKWPPVSDGVVEAILRYNSRQQRAIAGATQNGSFGPESGGSTLDSGSMGDSNDRSSSLDAEYATLTPFDLTNLRTSDGKIPASEMASVTDTDDVIASPISAVSSSRKLTSVALQFKLTSYDNTTLRIRLKDVAIVYTISERMGLSTMTSEEVLNRFHKEASGRSLTKMGFLRAMRDLVPRTTLSNEDQEFLSFHLLRIYALYEAESVLDEAQDDDESQDGVLADQLDDLQKTSSVEKLHLLAGMSIFCSGSKSVKLGVLFKLFDAHGDGFVSRRHLFELMKSILVVLFAFSSYNTNKAHTNDTNVNTWSTNSAAERAAGAVISKLFCEAKCRHPDAITLSEFASWYANGGYMDCPWLELLDLSKWPAKEAFEASKREKPLIYAFDMLEEGSILHFTESDISTYLFMLRSTKLGDLSVTKIYDTLLAFATPSPEEAMKMSRAEESRGGGQDYSYAAVEEDEGAYLELTRNNFYECIRNLVPKNDMSEKAQQTSSKILSRLFNVFDRKRVGRVNALELACGMSILGKGAKSQKLSMAFEFITKMRQQRHKTLNNYASINGGMGGGGGAGGMLGGVNSISTGGAFGWLSNRGVLSTTAGLRRSMLQNDADALPHSVLFIYLRSFLLAMMALSDGTYRLGLEKMYAEADDFIEEAMGDLMTEVTANGNNGGGYAGYGTARSRARVTFEQFGEWYNAGGFELISWVELLDVAKWEQQQDLQQQDLVVAASTTSRMKSTRMASQRYASTKLTEPIQTTRTSPKRPTQKKQIRQSDIVSSSYPIQSRGKKDQQQRLSTHRESLVVASLTSDGPIMVFAISAEAAELQFFNDDISRLRVSLQQTQLHQENPWNLCAALKTGLQALQATPHHGISKRQFISAVKTVCSDHFGVEEFGEETEDLLYSMLEVYIKDPTSSNGQYVSPVSDDDDEFDNHNLDVVGAVCGLMVICDGSLLEKLKCGTKLFDENMADHGVDTTLGALRSCLTAFLMAFYGMSCSLSGEVVRYSSQLGAEDVLRAFSNADVDALSPSQPKTPLDLSKNVSLRDFSEWFGESGYPSHPWVELIELQHWPAAINICGSETEES